MQRDVRGILSRLPKTLDETYERVLRDIHDDNKKHARRLLHCLAVAIRPLRVEELAEILAFDFDAAKDDIPEYHADWRWKDQEEAVLSTCSSLITIAEYNGYYNDGFYGSMRVVQFSHFTVREFLMADRLANPARDVSQYHILPEPAHTILAQACLGFLLHSGGCIDRECVKDFPLAKYAAEHWVAHAQFEGVASHVKQGMENLFDPEKPYFASWIGTHDMDEPFRAFDQRTRPTPLYYSALCGFHEIVKNLAIKYPQHANAIGGRYDFPLLAAFSRGHVRVAELLVEHGSDVNAHGTRGRTQLHTFLSSRYLDEGPVRFLLERGADPKLRNEDNETPLHILSLRFLHRTHRSTEDVLPVTQLLLEHGADPNSKSKDDETPLHILSLSYVHRTYSTDDVLLVAQLLLEHDADPNLKGKDGETPLHILLFGDHHSTNNVVPVARLFLEHGADPNSKSKDGETILHKLLHHYHHYRYRSTGDVLLVAQLLLEHGADSNSKSKDGKTSLHILSLRFPRLTYYSTDDVLPVAQLLLEHDADPDLTDKDGKTPLHILSLCYLHHTYSTGEVIPVAQLLLEHGTDPNLKDKDGETPLHILLSGDHHSMGYVLPVVQLFLEHGAGPNFRSKDGKTPLHKISHHYRYRSTGDVLSVAQLLLEHGADPNLKDKDGETPLHILLCDDHCSMGDDLPVTQPFLELGAGPNLKDKDGESPLHKVSHFYHPRLYRSTGDVLPVVQLLLEHGADSNSKSKDGKTPLHNLSFRYLHPRHYSTDNVLPVARLLLEHDADPNLKGKDEKTPLHILSLCYLYRTFSTGSVLPVAQLFLEHGADPNLKDKDGETPLHILLSGDHHSLDDVLPIAQLLLRHGADPNSKSKDGETPLSKLLHHYHHYRSHSHGDALLFSQLIEYGADLNIDGEGETPLQILLGGCQHRHSGPGQSPNCYDDEVILLVVKLLLEHGADVNSRDKSHESPLCLALRHEAFNTALCLLDHGADLDVEDKVTKTPLRIRPLSLECWLKKNLELLVAKTKYQ